MADWYYHRSEQTYGPVQESSIQSWIGSGFLAPDDSVWTEGMDEWQSVSEHNLGHDTIPNPVGAQPTSHVRSVYAAFHWRAIALFIDSFIMGTVLTLFFFERLKDLTPGTIMEDPTFSIAAIVSSIVYHSLWEASSWQASPGKRICRLRVVALDGTRISLPRALLRQIGKLASEFLFCFGFLMALFTPRRQTLHDLLARCLVVRNL